LPAGVARLVFVAQGALSSFAGGCGATRRVSFDTSPPAGCCIATMVAVWERLENARPNDESLRQETLDSR
jgi:hypothetical protein